jgi:hypothetical protein
MYKSINKLAIVIMLILFIVCIATYIELYTNINYTSYTINIDDIYDMIETGDVIYFSYTNFLKPYFSHVGMVVVDDKNNKYILDMNRNIKDNDKIYLLEMDGNNNDRIYIGNDSGVSLNSFKARILTYITEAPGVDIYISKLRNDKIPSLETTMQFINKISDYKNMYKFNNEFRNKVMFDCTRKKLLDMNVNDRRHGENSLICSEFVMMCLRDLGIVQPDADIYCKTPDDFLMLKDHRNKIYDRNYHVILNK